MNEENAARRPIQFPRSDARRRLCVSRGRGAVVSVRGCRGSLYVRLRGQPDLLSQRVQPVHPCWHPRHHRGASPGVLRVHVSDRDCLGVAATRCGSARPCGVESALPVRSGIGAVEVPGTRDHSAANLPRGRVGLQGIRPLLRPDQPPRPGHYHLGIPGAGADRRRVDGRSHAVLPMALPACGRAQPVVARWTRTHQAPRGDVR